MGCNNKLATLHSKLIESQAEQRQLRSELSELKAEVESLKTMCQSMRDHLGTIHTVSLRMETGMKKVMEKLQLDYRPATPQLQHAMTRIQENHPVDQLTPPAGFLPPPQITLGTQAASTPPQPAPPAQTPLQQPLPQPRRLMAALPLNNQTATRGKSKPGQTVEKVLQFMYDPPQDAAFAAGATT